MKIKPLLIFAVLATAVLCFSSPATAQAADYATQISELQAQIATLQAQLQQLQAQQPTTPQAWCYTFTKNMGYGAKGADYDALITVLNLEGMGDFATSGKPEKYDKTVGDAVIKLQAKYKISQTGYFGSQVRAKVNSIYKCQSASATISTNPEVTNTTPYIIGTATGVSQVGIVVAAQSGDKVFGSGLIPVTNGNWSVTVTPALALGHYVIYVYDANNNVLQKGPLNIVASTQPSIAIQGVNGSQTSSSAITANAGDTFTISGVPQNLQGMQYWTGEGYPPAGYYNRAYFFDQTFANNNSCGNNEASASGTWTMTCTAKVAGASTFYIVIYANGQSYASNTVSVTINQSSTTPSIKVTSPNGGETWRVGETRNVTWQTSNISSPNDKITLYVLSAAGIGCNIAQSIQNNGSYAFTVKDPSTYCGSATNDSSYRIGGKFKIMACAQTAGTNDLCSYARDYGDDYFTIVDASTQPSITVTSPLANDVWKIGETHVITWTSTGVNNVMIELDKTSPNTGWHLTYSVPASNGSHSWTIPSAISETLAPASDYYISIWDTTNPSIIGKSSNFTIATATIATCTDSDGGRDYFTKGTLNGYYNSAPITLTDFCVDRTSSSNGQIVMQCSGANCQLGERICNSSDATDYATVYYTCPNGCSNGVCVQSTTQPAITVTSPNGGERVAQGGMLNVLWNSASPTQSVDVSVVDTNGQVVTGFNQRVNPSNSTSQSIGFVTSSASGDNMYIAPGQYKAKVCSAGTDNCDTSDNYFTVYGGAAPVVTLSVNGNTSTGYQTPTVNLGSVSSATITWSATNAERCNTYGQGTLKLTDGTTWDMSLPISGSKVFNTTGQKDALGNTLYSASIGIQCWKSDTNLSTSRGIIVTWSVPTQPSITLTSPNGGETWAQGSTHSITWASTGLPSNARVYFSLIKGNMAYGFQPSVLASAGTYSWVIPTTVGSNVSTIGSNLKIRALALYSDSTGKSAYKMDDSDSAFAIVAAGSGQLTCADTDGGLNYNTKGTTSWTTAAGVSGSMTDFCETSNVLAEYSCDSTRAYNYKYTAYTCPNGCLDGACKQLTGQPSITITSPNGGETWKVGEARNITWTSTGLSSDAKLIIYLSDNHYNYSFASSVPVSQGSYAWTVPSTIGAYNTTTVASGWKMLVNTLTPATYVQDYSDNSFTIAAATSTCTGYASNSVVLNSMKVENGTLSFNLTNTTSSAQTVSVSIGSGSVSETTIVVPSGACALPTTITYSAPVSTTVTFTYSGNTIASQPVPSTAAVLPPVTIILPNGGTCIIGQKCNIAWTSSDMSTSTDNINIWLSDFANSSNGVNVGGGIAIGTPEKNGSYVNWTVPSNTPAGTRYKVGIGRGLSSYYSNYFTIATETTDTTTLNTPTLVMSTTTPAKNISSGMGAENASQASYNFSATGGTATITELKFSITGQNTVTKVCVGSVCAVPVAGVVSLPGLQLAVPNGGAGLTQNALVSYAPVDARGIQPGTTSSIALTYVKYITGGVVKTLSPNVAAPTMTLYGSLPTVTVPYSSLTSLMIGAQNTIGKVLVSADPQGLIKVRTITFNVVKSGFTGEATLTNAFLADQSNLEIQGSSCIISGSVVTCPLGTSFASDYLVPAGQTVTFNLVAIVNGSPASGSTPSISSSVSQSGFSWDDGGTDGTVGVGLSGAIIANFPTNAYTISAATLGSNYNPLNLIQSQLSALMQAVKNLMPQ